MHLQMRQRSLTALLLLPMLVLTGCDLNACLPQATEQSGAGVIKVANPPATAAPGQVITLGFRFTAADNMMNMYRGWHIDNVRIAATVAACVARHARCGPATRYARTAAGASSSGRRIGVIFSGA